jgi:hypothetical protein
MVGNRAGGLLQRKWWLPPWLRCVRPVPPCVHHRFAWLFSVVVVRPVPPPTPPPPRPVCKVGTPSQDFPVAIDSGSGDLDISGKGCVGCVHGGPNREYDHTASSTSAAAFPFVFSNSYQTCDLQDPTVGGVAS